MPSASGGNAYSVWPKRACKLLGVDRSPREVCIAKATRASLRAAPRWCACRDVEKMENVAEGNGWDKSSYKVMELDLASYDSTRKFHKAVKAAKSKPLDALVCNAAVYQPALPTVSHSRGT